MRVGIMTYFYSYNFGAMMQAYALKQSISRLLKNEDSVGLVNYCPPTYMNSDERWDDDRYIEYARKMDRFIRERCGVDNIVNDIHYAEEYDAYITGSDQVWNPLLPVKEPTEEYFLNFVPDYKKKISYAASIAEDVYGEFDTALFDRYIRRFDSISLREHSHLNFIEQFTDKKCYFVLDPVFLLDENDYTDIMQPDLNTLKDYVLCVIYNRRVKDRIYDLVNRFAIVNSLDVITYEKDFRPFDFLCNDSIIGFSCEEEILYKIKNAKIVITDSFHFLAFAVLFHIPVYACPYFRSIRLNDLLDLTGLRDRVITERTKPSDISFVFDYSETDRIIDIKKKESIDFPKNTLYGSD